MERRRNLSLREHIGPDAKWVAAQLTLFALAAIAGPAGLLLLGRSALPWPQFIDIAVGIIGIIAGAVVGGQSQSDLGDSLRIAPTPLDDASFVERGWYRRLRHPVYFAVLLGLLGWSFAWSSVLAVGVTALGFVFFSLKARHEERLLLNRYPEYADYRHRVRFRLIPGVW